MISTEAHGACGADARKPAVLHVALNPVTGPWSVMRELARAQVASGLFAGVGLGVVADKEWPARYGNELRSENGVLVFRATTLKLFGTGQFLWQRIVRPPLAQWADELASRTGARQVIVHFHNAWLSGVFLPLRRTRVPVSAVATFHGIAGEVSLRRQPVRRALHRWMARRLGRFNACLTSVDRQNLTVAEELFGLSQSRFSVVPNGVAPQTNDYGPFCRGAKTITVAHVGILSEGKGWRLAAEAVIALARAGRPVRLLIAGDGPDEPQVRRIAAENPACIEFLGYVQDPCSTVLPRVDLFVLMTNNDGLPMAILEAMACGVPVISTRIGGIPEAIRNGENGFLLSRDAASLKLVVESLLDHPGRLRTLSENTRRLFAERFDIAIIVREYHQLYLRDYKS